MSEMTEITVTSSCAYEVLLQTRPASDLITALKNFYDRAQKKPSANTKKDAGES